jgi:DNA-binding transcriptional MocR family regulator
MKLSKTDNIFQTLSHRIESGVFAEGAKLPSLRDAAAQFSASKNVVVTAYEKLVAHGVAISRPGAGFFVSRSTPTIAEPVNLREASDVVSLLHAQLDRPYEVLVGDGRPPEHWLLTSAPAVTMATGEAGYGTSHGLLALRERIASSQIISGIDVSPTQVVTTFGANHALDLIIRRFTLPGDTVLVDDPGYYPLFAKLKLAEVKVLGVPRTPKGPNPEALRAAVEHSHAKLFFTQSLVQNPTGSSIDLPTAHAILQIAERHDMIVVDDDPFTELPGVAGTRLAQLDQLRRVIQVGSFSKTLSPSLRSGYIIAEAQIAKSLAELKMILAINSSSYTERLIAETIRSGRYDKVRFGLAKRLKIARSEGVEKLKKIGFSTFAPIADGLYGLIGLPDSLSDIDVARDAAKQGIFLAPGSLFYISNGPHKPSLRINWSRVNDSRFFSFLRRMI